MAKKRDHSETVPTEIETIHSQPAIKRLILHPNKVGKNLVLKLTNTSRSVRKMNQWKRLILSRPELTESINIETEQSLHDVPSRITTCSFNSFVASLSGVTRNSVSPSLARLITTIEKSEDPIQKGVLMSLIISTIQTDGIGKPDAEKLSVLAIEFMQDQYHMFRCYGIKIAALLCQKLKDDTLKNLQDAVIEFISDPHAKVRYTSLLAVIEFVKERFPFQANIIVKSTQCLNDNDDLVRIAALNLITTAALHAPSSQQASLSENGFNQVCTSIGDLSPHVRRIAAALLSSFTSITDSTLNLTLDKFIMSDRRRRAGARDKPRELLSYQFEAKMSRSQDYEPQAEIQLTNVGAYGAFADGLEDEFLEVRLSTLHSMLEHARRSPQFALQCQDYIIDMFNDEIEEVRLCAINSLCEIADSLSLQEDQVEMITPVLKDSAPEIRVGVHRLLGKLVYSSHLGLDKVISGLLDNLQRYPADMPTIIEAMKALGSKSGHSELLVDGLVNTCLMFDTTEQNMEDKGYIMIMIFIFNAAARNPALVSILPGFCKQHFRYIKSAYPSLVPAVDALQCY